MRNPAQMIPLALATCGPVAAWGALALAPASLAAAGERVLSDYRPRSPTEQFALVLQAADEALEGLVVGLAGGGEGPATPPAGN